MINLSRRTGWAPVAIQLFGTRRSPCHCEEWNDEAISVLRCRR